jgi:hypothetical protein
MPRLLRICERKQQFVLLTNHYVNGVNDFWMFFYTDVYQCDVNILLLKKNQAVLKEHLSTRE